MFDLNSIDDKNLQLKHTFLYKYSIKYKRFIDSGIN